MNLIGERGLHKADDMFDSSLALTPSPELRRRREAGQEPKATVQQKHYLQRRKVLICMVGLPARGKSYTAMKLRTYLNWQGIVTKVFNAGQYRRTVLKNNIDQSASFFEASNITAKELRDKIALDVVKHILGWLEKEGDVAIFDATNTTRERRAQIVEAAQEDGPHVQILFIENICDDPYVIAENFRQKIMNSPDYETISIEEATHDLKMRIQNYQKVYEPIVEDSYPYIKIVNIKGKIIGNKVNGLLPQHVFTFLTSLHLQTRPIWFTRPAQSAVSRETSKDSNSRAQLSAEFSERGEDRKSVV